MTMKRIIHGFTLIEVLVAVVIVSLGILGIAGTLLTATRSSSSNYLKQQAVQDAYDIVDRMRANNATASQPVAAANPYIILTPGAVPSTTSPTPNCITSAPCSGTAMATVDVWEWQTLLKQINGTGTVTVTPGASGTAPVIVTVEVYWNDTPAQTAFQATTPATLANYTVVTAL